MRLEPIAPAKLTDEQRPLHDMMAEGIRKNLHGFTSAREDGALIGPFPAMLHFPEFGAAAWEVFTALAKNSMLPKTCHEVAILVTGATLQSRYELYSHERVAAGVGLSQAKIATISAGQRPADLTAEEGIAYDVAARLSRGGQLGDTAYKSAVGRLGSGGRRSCFT